MPLSNRSAFHAAPSTDPVRLERDGSLDHRGTGDGSPLLGDAPSSDRPLRVRPPHRSTGFTVRPARSGPGPGSHLSGQGEPRGCAGAALTSMRHCGRRPVRPRRPAGGPWVRLWPAGTDIEWPALHGPASAVDRVPLPTYPFERQRYWVARRRRRKTFRLGVDRRTTRRPRDLVLQPDLEAVHCPRRPVRASRRRRSLADVHRRMRRLLPSRRPRRGAGRGRIHGGGGRPISEVWPPSVHRRSARSSTDYDLLLQELRSLGRRAGARSFIFWSLTPSEVTTPAFDRSTGSRALGFTSLLFLAQALGDHGGNHPGPDRRCL